MTRVDLQLSIDAAELPPHPALSHVVNDGHWHRRRTISLGSIEIEESACLHEIAAAHAYINSPELRAAYPDEWVAIRRGVVIAHGTLEEVTRVHAEDGVVTVVDRVPGAGDDGFIC